MLYLKQSYHKGSNQTNTATCFQKQKSSTTQSEEMDKHGDDCRDSQDRKSTRRYYMFSQAKPDGWIRILVDLRFRNVNKEGDQT